MSVMYVGEAGATLEASSVEYELLWGDPCHVSTTTAAVATVRARGRTGTVEAARLVADPKLLEIYVIDVGQGDGVLMKTPDGKWHLIDGGPAADRQMTLKSAASFVRWKFFEDLRRTKVALESVVLTHPDADHYGGLIDVLAGSLPKPGETERWTFPVEVERFYHCGLARYAGSPALGRTVSGTADDFPYGAHGFDPAGTFLVDLLNGKGDFENPPRPLTKDFETLADLVAKVPGIVRAISHREEYLPGYAPAGAKASIRVLGPILESFGARKGLRELGGDSITRNGHSVVLRVDYGNARVMLTGDLNTKSQNLMLGHVQETEFLADVAKGCHHGSDDVDLAFVAALGARATVISSGDNEDYAHPRPGIIGASARFGREGVDPQGRRVPPLVYSTELARSVRMGHAKRAQVAADQGPQGLDPRRVELSETASGTDRFRKLSRTPVVFDLVYGLVNVRTDGEKILLATLEEKGNRFDKRWIRAGVGPG
jgi:beta-lactamase superfamily II metal-dependent hydrolase